MTITEWLDTAVRRLPYRVRLAARQELMDHFLDHAEALESANYSKEEAEALALEALGDPEETNRLLVKVHRPWLNWVLWGLRITLGMILLYALILFPTIRSAIGRQISFRQQLAYLEGRKEDPAVPVLARREGSCDDEIRLGIYRVSVHCASSSFMKNTLLEDYYEYRDLNLVLRFAAAPWNTPDPSALTDSLRITDDLGREYELGSSNPEAVSNIYSLYYMGRDLFASYYRLTLGRGPDVDELELRFQVGQESGTLRVRYGPWQFREGLLRGKLEQEEDAVKALLALPQQKPEDVPKLEALESGRGDAASNELLSASVPFVRHCQGRDGGRILENAEYMELILVLWGPAERLPQTHGELFSRLTVTDGEGNPYPLEEPQEWARYWTLYEPLRWENAVGYRLLLPPWYGGSADTLNLVYGGDGGPLELRLEAKEDTP